MNSIVTARTDALAPLLLDEALEQALDRIGVASAPFLGAEAVQALRALHDELHPGAAIGFDTDFAYVAPEHKRRVDSGIRAILEPRLGRLFGDVRLFNVTFVVKWPGGDSSLPVHQDWAYVDEEQHRCATLWIPLDDVSPAEDNGPLGVIPGSHRLPLQRRGANSVPWYLPYREELAKHLELRTTPAGHALVFDGSVLHGSPPNRTGRPRRAVTAMVARAEVPLRYHHRTGTDWEIYEVDDQFFVDHGPFDLRAAGPAGARLVRTEPATAGAVPRAELLTICGVDLPHLDVPLDEEKVPYTGDPLGGSAPPAPRRGGQLADVVVRWLHDAIARRRGRDAVAATPLPELDGLLDRGVVPTDGAGTAPAELATRFGTWRAVPLADHEIPDGWPRSLRGRSAAWLLEAGPHSELLPRRWADNGVDVVLASVGGGQLPGTLVVQSARHLDALDAGQVVLLDPTVEHRAWNIGAVTGQVLCAVTEREIGLLLRLCRRALLRLGVLEHPLRCRP